MLNPINGPGMSVETNPHRKRNAKQACVRTTAQDHLLSDHHCLAVHRYWVRRVVLTMIAWAGARKNEIDGQVHQSCFWSDGGKEVFDSLHIDPPRHFWIKLAMLELARSFGVQHGGKTVFFHKAPECVAIIDITGLDPLTTQRPIV